MTEVSKEVLNYMLDAKEIMVAFRKHEKGHQDRCGISYESLIEIAKMIQREQESLRIYLKAKNK
jgi:hypothetical protein